MIFLSIFALLQLHVSLSWSSCRVRCLEDDSSSNSLGLGIAKWKFQYSNSIQEKTIRYRVAGMWKIMWNKINKLETTFWIISRVSSASPLAQEIAPSAHAVALLLNNLICLRWLDVALSSTAYITTWIIGIFEQHCGFSIYVISSLRLHIAVDTLGSSKAWPFIRCQRDMYKKNKFE